MKLCSSPLLDHPLGAILVSLLQCRAEIGISNTRLIKYSFKSEYQANVCILYRLLHVFIAFDMYG